MRARSLCSRHYAEARRAGTLPPKARVYTKRYATPADRPRCSADGCERPATYADPARCHPHYARDHRQAKAVEVEAQQAGLAEGWLRLYLQGRPRYWSVTWRGTLFPVRMDDRLSVTIEVPRELGLNLMKVDAWSTVPNEPPFCKNGHALVEGVNSAPASITRRNACASCYSEARAAQYTGTCSECGGPCLPDAPVCQRCHVARNQEQADLASALVPDPGDGRMTGSLSPRRSREAGAPDWVFEKAEHTRWRQR